MAPPVSQVVTRDVLLDCGQRRELLPGHESFPADFLAQAGDRHPAHRRGDISKFDGDTLIGPEPRLHLGRQPVLRFSRLRGRQARLNLRTEPAEGRPFSREGQSLDGRDFRLGEAKPSMARRARARHVLPSKQMALTMLNDFQFE
jgi:hypothetical protein